MRGDPRGAEVIRQVCAPSKRRGGPVLAFALSGACQDPAEARARHDTKKRKIGAGEILRSGLFFAGSVFQACFKSLPHPEEPAKAPHDAQRGFRDTLMLRSAIGTQ
jgi:hypothetical protein